MEIGPDDMALSSDLSQNVSYTLTATGHKVHETNRHHLAQKHACIQFIGCVIFGTQLV